MAEAFGGTHRVLLINPYTPARTELIGNNTKQASSRDVGKAVKVSGDTTALCAYGDEIYGFIESVEAGSANGYSIGGVLSDRGHETVAKDEVGDLAVGDFVAAGTPVAFGTALPAGGPNVIKLQTSAQVNMALSSGGLAIKAAASPTVKTVNTVYAFIDGQLVSKAAGDMPALVGTVAANTFNVWCFLMDSAGALTAVQGTEGATAAAVQFPAIPAGKVMIGFILVTHSALFTGGTTALDTATTVYVNTPNVPAGAQAHRWQVFAKYTSGAHSGSVLLRKV